MRLMVEIALVLQRAEDGVLDEVGSALADGVDEPLVGLGDLGVEQRQVAVDLGLRGGGDRGQLRGHVRAGDGAGAGVRRSPAAPASSASPASSAPPPLLAGPASLAAPASSAPVARPPPPLPAPASSPGAGRRTRPRR